MAIAASDIVAYAAANMPSDDSATLGGAIDTLRRVDFTQMSTTDQIEVLSSNGGDTTQTVTLRGRLATGAINQEVVTLTGTSPATSVATYERLIKAELSASCTGTVTVRKATGDVTIRTIPPSERGFMAIFRELASDPSSTKNYYGKFFWKNCHPTLTYLATVCQQSADGTGLSPPDGVTHLPGASNDDSVTTSNRLTAPAAGDTLDPDTFDDSDKTTGDIAALSARAVWLRLRLPAAQAPIKADYTAQITGSSV